MPSINKCIVFLALALSVSALGSGHDSRAHHQGMARHIQRNPSPDMDMIAPNPLKKRQTTRNNSKRCQASQEQASSASVSSASVASVSSKSAAASKSSAAAASSSKAAAAAASSSKAAAAAKSSADAKASSEAAAAKSSSEEKQNQAAKTSKSPQPSPTKASGGSSNSGGGLTTGGVATFFTQNGVEGACGKVHSDDDVVCALQTQTYAGGSNCGKTVAITNTKTGKTVNVLVADECPTCDDPQSIDLSEGAFKALGGTVEEGEFPIAWKML